ncbi:hypothetical protein SGM_4182 [Streptomyces griseoaurantiacus M045]|uniref:Uncharacterized protein n=1 Tax=Streptomyces griseoaurantiacus M045 TaxID=996637 RepID=F3NLS7_9ACTN|nr:hypothetical protein SGM_4182 [Streptomyces griseoaurantiacus M045]
MVAAFLGQEPSGHGVRRSAACRSGRWFSRVTGRPGDLATGVITS